MDELSAKIDRMTNLSLCLHVLVVGIMHGPMFFCFVFVKIIRF